MTDNKSQFVTFEPKNRVVTFRDNGEGCIMGIGNIRITPSTFIQNILLVDRLKYNLLSIS